MTSAAIAIAGAAAAYAGFGRRAALSLTIGAAIAIFNFLFLEAVTGRLLKPRLGSRFSDFAVPLGEIAAAGGLLVLVFQWKGFDIVAGLAGLSVIVAAIGVEAVIGLRRG